MARKKNITGVKGRRSYDDPRVAIFKQYFLDPKSPTFMNTLQSGLRAGYSQEYSESIGAQRARWYVEMLESTEGMRAQLLASAERALVEATQYDSSNKDYAVLKLKASTFVSERLGKDAYSARQELTGAGGKRLFDDEKRERAKMPLSALFKGVQEAPKHTN